MSYRKEHMFSLKAANYTEYAGVDFSQISTKDLQELWRETLENGMHGLCFSMYEDGQKPGDIITEEQVTRRLDIIKPYTKWVRSFSCVEGNEHIPRIAHQKGLKTLVGAWLGDDLEMNEAEIEGLITLAKQGFVDVAAVGNEVLYRKELTEDQLLEYIHRVKEAIPGIPVGYVDAYYEFSAHPKITKACDVILANCYPYWEGCNIEYSLNHMQQMYAQALHAGNGKKVIITETGWPSEGGSLRGAVSSNENAMKYFINSQVWSTNDDIEMFYFSSFDESWKVGAEGDVGAYWGLWDKDEKLKF
ncbi:MAG: glycosyl hydrolase [Flavobacteriales bacterium]|nr:glycosyl hydrolase [Flavobacteriia bacterium]NCP06210.1 glycosyl hydrolase [Flavobacteriales bacterium]PIV93806.1 MAG: glycosyl hydrolase [Flavobacteriaceae bacterium CG17_big_fil_post_rev_8_21_14_2_50_33_15]PIY09973.1 MAG: glycosyl hydrolase [Flavobacteriaceae bacterium CG_4_10_14_3_um_filter_33_47]PJB19455.1 MAG: glycosyl hydrolase [Flavobacteriaceae bacterium CG_4_9_14_3_um_filter_33_16]